MAAVQTCTIIWNNLKYREKGIDKMQEDVKKHRKIPVRYLAVTVFCLIVSVIYGRSSLLQAAGLFPFKKKSGEGQDPEAGDPAGAEILRDIYRFGIAALTAASFLSGVLEIAGTDSFYPEALMYAGAVMLVCGAAGVLFLIHRNTRQQA